MKKALIIYRFLPHYRREFYNGLKDALEKEGVELQLVYGKTNKVEALRNDEIDLDWATYKPNYYMKLGKIELLWQPCLKDMKGQDILIVEQANKLIINYIFMLIRHVSKFKLGVWGHGRNMQIKQNSLRNRFKNLFLNSCDVYFAYTKGVKDFLVDNGFPAKKVVVVQNAIETSELRKCYLDTSNEEVEELKAGFGISGTNVGIFCGGMYAEKRIDFMLEVCKKVKTEVPDFHMLFIGAGVEAWKVEQASKEYAWIHYVGPKLGLDRVKYFKLASVQLMPGLVGLGVLDSFVLEAPMFTTEYPYHSPEIEYLENGFNGYMTKNTFEDYSNTVIEVLRTGQYNTLKEGCIKSAEKYTINNMVENFKNGILENIKQHK